MELIIQLYYALADRPMVAPQPMSVYASHQRSMVDALIFLRRVLHACDGKPTIVVDRGPRHPWALRRLGMECLHETYGERNRVEIWFRTSKERIKRFHSNVNARTVAALEEFMSTVAHACSLRITQAMERGNT